jgi:hypothetical protein
VALIKMNKKIGDIRDGKPDAGDCENDATDEEDIHLEMNATFTEEDNIVSKLGPMVPVGTIKDQVELIARTRSQANKQQTKQANKMLAGNKKAINSFKVGDLVLLPVDSHYLGAADAPNKECVILEKIGDIQFRLGLISGVLKECVTYNVLQKMTD